MKSRSAVDKLADLIRAAAPDLPEGRAREIASSINNDLAGDRLYFAKAPAEGKALRLGEQLAAGVPLAQAFERVGVSRSTGYRLLNRTWRLRSA
jgi:hypothetical protein